MTTTRHGYIGLGMMGSAMAGHLAATDSPLTVFDLDAEAMDKAVGRGATAAESPAAVAAASDIVSICVPAAEHIDAVLGGTDGIGDGAHDGLTILIHSTVLPETITAARDTAAAWGVPVFDACVAGGPENAKAGELAMLVGGWDEMDAATQQLITTYGSKVINGGPVGSGAAVKIGINVMTYMQMAAARISFALMDANGARSDALVDAWRHIGQLGTLTEQYLTILSFDEKDLGALHSFLSGPAAIAVKDLELAGALGPTVPELDAVIESLTAAMPTVMRVA